MERSNRTLDLTLIMVVLGLCAIGVTMVYTATYDESGRLWLKQLIVAVAGIGLATILYFIPAKLLYAFAYLFYFVSLIPLIYIILKSNTVERWISLPGGLHLQPSEFTKIALLLTMAKYFSEKKISLLKPQTLIIPFVLFFIPFVLVLKQPNLSTALSLAAMTLAMTFWAGLTMVEIILLLSPIFSVVLTFHKLAWGFMFLVLIILMVVRRVQVRLFVGIILANIAAGYGAIFIWNKILYDHQRSRILTFVDPQRDPLGAGYQVLQSQVAIGSGEVYGKGFMNGTQTNLSFLPEEHTDFIFSVLGEQFGFLGCLVVLTLYFLLVYNIFRGTVEVNDQFANFVSIGTGAIFSFHIFVNISMTVGLMPVTGLPLPFFSYGGSFLLACFAMIGIVLNLRSRRKLV